MAVTTILESDQAPAGSNLFLTAMGPDLFATRPLPESGVLRIGRSEDLDFRITDPAASRVHACLHVSGKIEIEDLGSANGTFLRDSRLAPGERHQVTVGEAITIGGTVLMVQRRPAGLRTRRLWSHAYFVARLEEECDRADALSAFNSSPAAFAVARLSVSEAAAGLRAVEGLVASTRPGDVLGCYGPEEYEVLLVDSSRSHSERILKEIAAGLDELSIRHQSAIAVYPEDGRSAEALMAHACQSLRGKQRRLGSSPRGDAVVMLDPAMLALYEKAKRYARGTINLLILGETGVGKEVLARQVHEMSPRAKKPFVAINCAALPENLLESELFGHERGAFTGAQQAKLGKLEAASGGTMFLDEIGEMSPLVQAKLLRAIELQEVTRVGAVEPRKVDVRFIAATNRSLEDEVMGQDFRRDLYYRLNGASLVIPPLRERPAEIEALAVAFATSVSEQLGRSIPTISPAALAVLKAYHWPGNIRELRNDMERAVHNCDGNRIEPDHLLTDKMRVSVRVSTPSPGPPPTAAAGTGGQAPGNDDPQREVILRALERCAGNQSRAARLLNMPRRTFCRRLDELGIPRPQGRD